MKIILKDLTIEVEGKKIIDQANLEIDTSKLNVLMGKNGTGKSTILNTIMGNPEYKIKEGKIILEKTDYERNLGEMTPDEIAKEGIFLSFQNPVEIPGVSVRNFLRSAYNSKFQTKIDPEKFEEILKNKIIKLGLSEEYLDRSLNDGFSGGEKKKSEILQMLVLKPNFVMLDEIDSGLDINSLKIISGIINEQKDKTGFLIVTHYKRILEELDIDNLFILNENGKIVKENPEKIDEIEKEGFEK